MENKCTVILEGEVRESDDFVAILSAESGNTTIMYQTDALTLGMALKLIAKAFVENMSILNDEQRNSITEVLGNDFSLESIAGDRYEQN